MANNLKFELLEEDAGPKKNECQICLNNMETHGFPIMKLACGHIYHDECIHRWSYFQNKVGRAATCPTCRQTLTVDKESTEKENTEVDPQTTECCISADCCFSFCFAYRRRHM